MKHFGAAFHETNRFWRSINPTIDPQTFQVQAPVAGMMFPLLQAR